MIDIDIAKVKPSKALATLMDNNVIIHTSATESYPIRCYAPGERGNKGLGDEYIEVLDITKDSLTEDMCLWDGFLAVYIQIKTQTDTRFKTQRIDSVVSQVQKLIHRKSSQGYFFKLTPRPITPTSANTTTGYSTTILNVEWHTTDEFLRKAKR